MSIFLTDHSARHTLLTKQKSVGNKGKLRSNSSRLTNWVTRASNEESGQERADESNVVVLDEEDEGNDMSRIPEAPVAPEDSAEPSDQARAGDGATDKPAVRTRYDGFSIYGHILCLVVKRRGPKAQQFTSSQQMLETWVSTQAAQDFLVEDGDG